MAVTEKQKQYLSKYENSHERVTVMFPLGTRERIANLGLDCTAAYFCKFAVDAMLNQCERMKENEKSMV